MESSAQLTEEYKDKFERKLKAIVEPYFGVLFEEFEDVIEEEFRKLIDRIRALKRLPQDIAENLSLKENLFCIFVAIYSETPLFICGKPGSSKSISMQIIQKTFDGTRQGTESSFMDGMKPLQMVYYQGSDQSTDKGIQRVFEKAASYQRAGSRQSVVFMDEIGLAELSPNNPLKVIHRFLDTTSHSGCSGKALCRLGHEREF